MGGNGDCSKFSWGKGFGVGSGLPDLSHFVTEWGGGVHGCRLLRLGVCGHLNDTRRGWKGFWRARRDWEFADFRGNRSRRKRRCSCPALKRVEIERLVSSR